MSTLSPLQLELTVGTAAAESGGPKVANCLRCLLARGFPGEGEDGGEGGMLPLERMRWRPWKEGGECGEVVAEAAEAAEGTGGAGANCTGWPFGALGKPPPPLLLVDGCG